MFGRVVAAAATPVQVTLQAVPHRPDLALMLESGRLARLSPGAVLLSTGSGASMLATAIPTQSSLSVDFRERAAARGTIPNTFPRRELAPAPSEITTSRLIDRALRPALEGHSSMALSVRLLSSDRPSSVSIDALAVNAASAATAAATYSAVSSSSSKACHEAHTFRPIGAARVALVDGNVVAFPSLQEVAQADVSLCVATRDGRILSLAVDSVRAPTPEPDVLELLCEGVSVAEAMIQPQYDLVERIAALRSQEGRSDHPRCMPKKAKVAYSLPGMDAASLAEVESLCLSTYESAFVECRQYPGKAHRADVMTRAQQSIVDAFPACDMDDVLKVIHRISRVAYQNVLVRDSTRIDGRQFDEVRPVRCETSVLGGAVHGSALFERGDTQVLACATIGLNKSALKTADHVDTVDGDPDSKPFYVHYSFPGYATGESEIPGSSGGGSRREVGHGALAESALRPLVDHGRGLRDSAVARLSAEVTSSDGSSSMATVCAGTLALMDAGVHLRKPVAGVAIGMVAWSKLPLDEESKEYVLLTDILGAEDHFGSMDCKITGTIDGITATQLDVKVVAGLPVSVVRDAYQAGKVARERILEMMGHALPKAQEPIPDHAPRSICVSANRDVVVKTLLRDRAASLKTIEKLSGARVSFENVGDDSVLRVDAPSAASAATAERLIHEVVSGVPVGMKLRARVVDTKQAFAILECEDGALTGMLHVSKINLGGAISHRSTAGPEKSLDQMRYRDVRQMLKKGQSVDVVVIESDVSRNILRFSLSGPESVEVGNAFLQDLASPADMKKPEAKTGLFS